MNRMLPCLAVLILCVSLSAAAQVRPTAAPPLVLPQAAQTPFNRLRTPVSTPTPMVTATPTPTPTPDIPLPPVNISLERISILRSRFYNPDQAERPVVWKPRMLLEFQVSVPKDWTLMSVDDGQLTSITDSRDRPIAPRAAIGPEGEVGKPGQAIALAVKPDRAAFEFTTELPERDADRLGNITATFALTLGISKPVKIEDIRSRKTATSLLPKDQFPDIIVALDQVGNDSISVAVLGDLSKVGGIAFKGPDGATLNPITQERTEGDPQPGKTPGYLYRYSFEKLPKQISMELNYFSEKRRAVYTYKNNQIPLP